MTRDPGQADSAGPDAQEPEPAIPLTTPIREANGVLTYMGSDGRRYVVFGEPPNDRDLLR